MSTPSRLVLVLGLSFFASACSKGTCVESVDLSGGTKNETCTINLPKDKCVGDRGTHNFIAENGEKGQLHCLVDGYKKTDLKGSQLDDAVKNGDIIRFSKP